MRVGGTFWVAERELHTVGEAAVEAIVQCRTSAFEHGCGCDADVGDAVGPHEVDEHLEIGLVGDRGQRVSGPHDAEA